MRALPVLAALAAVWLAPAAARGDGVDVIPRPALAQPLDGPPALVGQLTPIIVAPGDAASLAVARRLANLAMQSRGLRLVPRLAARAPAGRTAIVLERRGKSGGAEAYRLDIGGRRIAISATTRAGLLYGAVTLWQIMTAQAGHGGVALSALHVEDAPRFAWRGLLLDSARHFQTPEEIERLIDEMALHKLNVLEWHLTDDQAWRLEVPRYPRLTAIGAWRIPAFVGAPTLDPATGRPALYGGFYTRAQVGRIVAYAAARNVTIVPEIEMPGHAVAALLAYPKLSAGTPPPRSIQSDWGVFPYAFGIDEPVFDFLGVALNEVMDIFPSRFIAVGGDEVVAEAWTGAPKVQARMKALGLADAGAAHAWFIGRIGAILAARGRRLIGWDEILEGGGLPAGDAVASWRGAAPARTAVASGHDVVLAVSPTLYLDHRQSDLPGEPAGRGDVVSLADVYAFDPQLPPPTAPAPGPAVAPGKVLGLEGALWTEHISTFPHLQAMAFPRAAAVAELGWSPAAGHDWADFLARLPAEFARFETLGMAEDESALKVKADVEPALAVRRRASQELRGCTDKVTLNLEGAAAASGARPVYLVDIMNPCWIWPGADLSGVSALSVGVDRLPFNFQIGAARDRIDLRPPATADGELEVHLDGCASPTAAVLPLAPAVARPGPAILTAPLAPQSGRHDLCFVFTAARIDPMWVLGFVQLEPSATAPGPA